MRHLARLIVLLVVGPLEAAQAEQLEGLWRGSLAGEECILEIKNDEDLGRLGLLHMVGDGKELSRSSFWVAEYAHPHLRLQFSRSKAEFRGELAETCNRLQGQMLGAGGEVIDLQLVRCSLADAPELRAWPEATYSYMPPPNLGDGWATASLEEVGILQAAAETIVGDLGARQAALPHAVLVAVEGRLVLELYFHGFSREDFPCAGSAAPVVSSLLVGAAIDRGFISGPQAPLLSFFPALRSSAAPGWERLRLDELLTMSLGLDWDDGDESTCGTGPTFFARVLGRRPRAELRECWRPVKADLNLLSGVLREATGLPVESFAEQALFAPLDIRAWDWREGSVGEHRIMCGSLSLRPRDLAKLGQLVLDHGRWNGRQVIPAAWIAESTSPLVETGRNEYASGYLWMSRALVWAGSRFEFYVESPTTGGLAVVVLPAHRLVLVLTGGSSLTGTPPPDIRGSLIALLANAQDANLERVLWGPAPLHLEKP